MEDLLQLQLLARQQRTPYAVATIVEATGSTPRTEGKMLVYADGRSAGTIGGGLAELRAKKDAADAIRCGKNRLVRYEVVPQAAASGMACGGALQVFIEVYGTRPLLVVCGGGHNHRYGLSDAVMVKDNHVAALAEQGIDLSGAIRHIREQVGHTTHIEVEVDRLDQIPQALAGGADTIMLDNFSLDDTRRGVDLIGGRAIVEASGTMTLERVPSVAATGVDVISVGALTHSVRSIDLGLDWA